MTFLDELNPTQREAVTFDGGPMLVLAGAGSGKTKVLTSRIAYLVRERDVPPERILAVTFTNKAAGEMRDRLRGLMGEGAERLWLGTFHSLGLRILKKEGHLAGLGTDLTIYDNDDQLRLVKLIMEELSLNTKAFSPRAVVSRINQAKNENLSPEEYLSKTGDFFASKTSEVFRLYQKRLREMNALDFGDLICEPVNLFRRHPGLLNAYQDRFLHILVDEYQDTNRAQYMLMTSLASGHRNLCAVGDPDQSIYAWRGADIRNILEFERDWSDAKILRLEQNYRSTRRILAAANSVIEKNRKRYEKRLWTDNHEGELPVYMECRNEHHEALSVIERIRSIISEDGSMSYRDFAVFYRTNAQSRVLEECLIRESVPYTIVGGVRFYERREIKDALSFLRVVANPRDDLSLKRIINVPPRGIGAVTLEEVSELARKEALSLYDAFREAISRGVVRKNAQLKLFEAFERARGEAGTVPVHELAMRLLEDTGYIGMWEKEATEEAYQRIENLHELVSAMKDFEDANESATLQDFLDQVSLISDVDSYEDAADRVTLMTIHSAKGLEFPVVFMVGMEEGLFPHSRSTESDDGLEEERRLCYVGMTRAKKRLFLFSAGSRTLFGESNYQMPSRFIDEIAPEFIESIDRSSDAPSAKEVFREQAVPDEPYYTLDDTQLDPLTDNPWRVGMRVRHPSFGVGVIKAREGTGGDAKLTISFQRSGPKKLVARYASLEPLSV